VSNNKLIKEDLIKNLNTKIGFPNSFSKKLIEDIIEIIVHNIKNGSCNIKNVGSFKLIKKNERIGRNPKTKEEFIITSRKAISFTPSKRTSKKLINSDE
jgi:integration host factor subunit alpha